MTVLRAGRQVAGGPNLTVMIRRIRRDGQPRVTRHGDIDQRSSSSVRDEHQWEPR